MYRTLALCLLCLPACICAADAEEARQIVAVPGAVITLDGILDEAVWQNAPVTEPFMLMSTHREAPIQTRARIAYDRERVYVGVEVDQQGIQDALPPARERDADETWKDHCVELFFAPDPSSLAYYHLILSATGSRYDAAYGTEGLATAWNPEPDWQVATQVSADRWTAEAAIPFAALGAQEPLRGEVWGFKVCRSVWAGGPDRRNDAHTSWSFLPSAGYHDPTGWGRLYFTSTNALVNGNFALPIGEDGLPRGWRQQLVWQADQAPMGAVSQVGRDGKQMMLLHKNPEARGQLLPRVSSAAKVRGGRRFRATASVRATGTVQLALTVHAQGGASSVPTVEQLTGDDFRLLEVMVDAPADAYTIGVQLSFDREPTGDMLVRSATLTDLGPAPAVTAVSLNHDLTAATSTCLEMKPYERVTAEDGSSPYERLIFTDMGTGTEVWRMTWDYHHAGVGYSNSYPWNVDGSCFKFDSWERPGNNCFVATPNGAAFRPLKLAAAAQGARWSREPDWLVYGTRDSLMRLNWRTGELETVFTIPEEIKAGGRPSFAWDLDLPGLVYFEQAFGPDAPLYFIDLKTGTYTRIPITTDSPGDPRKDWLYSARLNTIGGTWYVGYSLNHLPHLSKENPYQQRLGTLDGKTGLNRLSLEKPADKPAQPLYSHGGTAPSGRYETGYYGGGIALWNFDTWEGRMLVPGPQDGHISWMYLNDWFMAGTSGKPLSGPFSSVLLKVYTDGTWYHVCYGNTSNDEYNRDFFTNYSPDGTKASFGSDMLGGINLFWCVISYPDPPVDVQVTAGADGVRLTWQAPLQSAEIAGYNVYRSEQSGMGYTRLTGSPVADTNYTDAGARAGYYMVTSVERSGLESRCHSGEVAAGDPAGPERLFIEAERGRLTAPVRENLHGSASNLLFIDYRSGDGDGSAAYTFPTRHAAPHALWARCRYRGGGSPAAPWQVAVEGKPVGAVQTSSTEWEWVRIADAAAVGAGGAAVTLTANGPGLAVDKLLLTDDADYRPQGGVKLDDAAPSTPSGLALTEARPFDVSMTWEPAATDVHHYQVYRGQSADFEPGQETLVGSPAIPSFVEWGLRHGQQYFYKVAAVDSFGNQSPPTPALPVQTPPLPQVVSIGLEAEECTISQGGETLDETDASGGKIVKMAPFGEADAQGFPQLRADFEVPVAGEYIIWLRLCPVSKDRQYSYLSASVDGGRKNQMLCYYPGREVTLSFRDESRWVYVNDMRRELPVRFGLEAGKHSLVLSEAYMQDFGIDRMIVTNDLSTRPEGWVR